MADNTTHHEDKSALMLIEGVRQATHAGHLYVNDAGKICDHHIETMFEDLFYGRPLDAVFRANFASYYNYLTGYADSVPQTIFMDADTCKKWVEPRFGNVTSIMLDDLPVDPELSHCLYRTVFEEPARFEIDPCFAPSELASTLLCVVTVIRGLASEFNEARFTPSPGALAH